MGHMGYNSSTKTFSFRMIKWLKDRQLGNTVNKKTIYEHIPVGRKFEYKGIINFERQPRDIHGSPIGSDWQCSNLKWTPDGNNLVIVMSEFLADRQNITILDPNADAEHLVKTNINLDDWANKHNFYHIEFQDTRAILSGHDVNEDLEGGCIGILSLSNGKLEQVIRKGFIQFDSKIDIFNS